MKKHRLAWMMALVCFLVLLSACAPKGAAPAGTQKALTNLYPMTITDSVGRQVTIEKEPQRIVSASPSNTEILFALGLGDKVVGVTTFCNYPKEAVTKEKIGDFRLNKEKIISLKPDIVFATTGAESLAEELAEVGIKTVIIAPQNIKETQETIKLMARITNRQKEGEAVVNKMDVEQKAVQSILPARDKKVKVFVLLDANELYTVGPHTFLDELITLAGGENIAADVNSQYPKYSEEVLLQKNPDVILVTFPIKEQVLAKETWQNINAVKNGRVIELDGDLVTRPGPRLMQGLKQIARALYPECFTG